MALVWLGCMPTMVGARDGAAKAQFQPPEVSSASSIPDQPLSAANGTLVLDVLVSEKGEVSDIEVRRDLPPLTNLTIGSVKTWRFVPGKVRGRFVAERVTVAVNFNPPSVLGGNVPLPPLEPQEDQARLHSSYQPPDVTFAVMPSYPFNAAGPGTVVLVVNVDETGKVQSTKVVRDAPPFTAKALLAAVDWKFLPATLNGKPIRSTSILAFVFRLPNIPPVLPL